MDADLSGSFEGDLPRFVVLARSRERVRVMGPDVARGRLVTFRGFGALCAGALGFCGVAPSCRFFACGARVVALCSCIWRRDAGTRMMFQDHMASGRTNQQPRVCTWVTVPTRYS